MTKGAFSGETGRIRRDGGKKRKKDGRNMDKKEMEKAKERVQKPSEREQLRPQKKLNPSADERRAESRFSDKWDNAT